MAKGGFRPRPEDPDENEVLFELGRARGSKRERAPRPPKAPRVEILRDAPGWVALLKPAGVASVRERWNRDAPTALSLLHREWQRSDPAAPLPFVVHRIDKETSGLLLFAKDAASARHLSEAFRHRRIRKEYLALVVGAPPEAEGTIEVHLVPDPRRPELMRVAPKHGKRSVTAWTTEERFRGYALLRLTPRTGRTHQLRVTLAHMGCPIVADHLYGTGEGLYLSRIKRGYVAPKDHPEFPLIQRVALHAQALRFRAPESSETDEDTVVEAPLPKDFRVAVERLQRHAPWRGERQYDDFEIPG